MKTFKNQAAQGDLLLIRVDSIPEGFVKQPNKGVHVVAHSETGHNHVVSSEHVNIFAMEGADDEDEFTAFMQVSEPTELRHLRAHDTHESLQIPAGTYKIKRQREYTPEGFRRAAD